MSNTNVVKYFRVESAKKIFFYNESGDPNADNDSVMDLEDMKEIFQAGWTEENPTGGAQDFARAWVKFQKDNKENISIEVEFNTLDAFTKIPGTDQFVHRSGFKLSSDTIPLNSSQKNVQKGDIVTGQEFFCYGEWKNKRASWDKTTHRILNEQPKVANMKKISDGVHKSAAPSRVAITWVPENPDEYAKEFIKTFGKGVELEYLNSEAVTAQRELVEAK